MRKKIIIKMRKLPDVEKKERRKMEDEASELRGHTRTLGQR